MAGRTEPIWVRWTLITIALGFLGLFIFLPLSMVFITGLNKGIAVYLKSINNPDALSAIRLTLVTALIAVPLNLIFGIAASWAIAKFDFWGKSFLTTLIDLPLSVSPAVQVDDPKIEEQYHELLTKYYQNPRPHMVPKALAYFAESKFVRIQSPEALTALAYVFGKIAKIEPSLIPKYLDVFSRTNHKGRLFVLTALELCGNERVTSFLKEKALEKGFKSEKRAMEETLKRGIPATFNPLTQEVKNSADIDILWAEFFVTGQTAPIVKIIDVVGREDRFRHKLSLWMLTEHSQGEKTLLDNLLKKELQLDADVMNAKIEYAGDMDTKFSFYFNDSEKGGIPSQQALDIQKILALSEEDLQYMAVKATALWSLRESVLIHPLVFKICEQEVKNHNLQAQFELRAIIESIKGKPKLGQEINGRESVN